MNQHRQTLIPGGQVRLSKRPAPSGKRDAGALLFYELYGRLTADQARIEATMLKVTRAVAQLVRRVDVLEECTRLYRGILGLEQPVVRFGCISCRHDFDLPLAEAQALNFTPLCPECHNWALPFPKQEYFTAHQIAALAGFPYRTVLKMIHTRGFEKASKEPGAKHGKAPAYDETTVRELLMTLKESPAPYRSNRLQAVRNR